VDNNRLNDLAKYVGDDWKYAPYYNEAELAMDLWKSEVWPFIKHYSFSCVLDLAAGHGRNSNKFKNLSQKIYIVDINQENIDFCMQRFKDDYERFEFIKNNGYTLDEIADESITLAFCYDSMVHFDSDVIRSYLKEFRRILKLGCHGFCHHSNYTENPTGNFHDNPGWRNYMSQTLFAHYCYKEKLTVIKSQIIRSGLDCITVFKKS